ncbi:hypothetical protein PG985_012423 [Apiospora marii]|uniref:Uncharacterized protein n=1 Tax=Apiospora marii TaxID=335849 RepID=A0ABR1REB7_9PEZI
MGGSAFSEADARVGVAGLVGQALDLASRVQQVRDALAVVQAYANAAVAAIPMSLGIYLHGCLRQGRAESGLATHRGWGSVVQGQLPVSEQPVHGFLFPGPGYILPPPAQIAIPAQLRNAKLALKIAPEAPAAHDSFRALVPELGHVLGSVGNCTIGGGFGMVGLIEAHHVKKVGLVVVVVEGKPAFQVGPLVGHRIYLTRVPGLKYVLVVDKGGSRDLVVSKLGDANVVVWRSVAVYRDPVRRHAFEPSNVGRQPVQRGFRRIHADVRAVAAELPSRTGKGNVGKHGGGLAHEADALGLREIVYVHGPVLRGLAVPRPDERRQPRHERAQGDRGGLDVADGMGLVRDHVAEARLRHGRQEDQQAEQDHLGPAAPHQARKLDGAVGAGVGVAGLDEGGERHRPGGAVVQDRDAGDGEPVPVHGDQY